MNRTFAIGDIHGRYEALKEVLSLSKFDYDKDKLIVLGDVVDGGYHTYQVVEELLKIKNLIFILGNHDIWVIDFMRTGWSGNIWIHQGGANTLKSYHDKLDVSQLETGSVIDESEINLTDVIIPITHQEFFNKGIYYHIENNMLFVHAGINPAIPKITSQSQIDLTWDRDLIKYAKRKPVKGYRKIFIGHSTTQLINGTTEPVIYNNLYCLDCGAGWSGRLAIMDVDTEEYWLSEIQQPGGRGET